MNIPAQNPQNQPSGALSQLSPDSGQGTDTVLGHLSLGEIVIPRAMLDDPQFMQLLQSAFQSAGMDIAEFTVGDDANKINPETGYPEFFSLRKLFKGIISPITASVNILKNPTSKKAWMGLAQNATDIDPGEVMPDKLRAIGNKIEPYVLPFIPVVGPALAAAHSFGQNGNAVGALANAAASYIGQGGYGAVPSAMAGAGASYLNGGSAKDALLSGALNAGNSYMHSGGLSADGGDTSGGHGLMGSLFDSGGDATSAPTTTTASVGSVDSSLPWSANASPQIDTSLPWISSNPAYTDYGNMANSGQLATISPSAGNANTSGNSGAPAASKGVLGSILDKIESNPISSAASALQIAGALNGQANKNQNAVSQQDIVANMKAKQAKDAAYSAAMRNSLNNSTLARNQINSPIDYYTYGQRPQHQFFDNVNPRIQFAKGGLASLGGGQDDSVPADLSEGEFVMPADVVAHLGDGNTQAGGKKLHQMVSAIRSHKSTKGMPPKAKAPQAYLPKNKGALGGLGA